MKVVILKGGIMIVSWIYKESEELDGIKRNLKDIFEISDSIAKQLIKQGKVKEEKKEKEKKDK
jgi:hypothetical protein